MEHVEPAEPAGGTAEQPAPPPGAEEVALPGQIPADDGTVGTVQPAGEPQNLDTDELADRGGTAKGRAFVQARFSDLGGVRKIFTTYKTAQYVVIEDISLAVIYRVIQLIVLIYAVIMLMYWHEYNVMHETKSTNNQYAAMNSFTGNTEEFCSGAGVSGSDYVRIL